MGDFSKQIFCRSRFLVSKHSTVKTIFYRSCNDAMQIDVALDVAATIGIKRPLEQPQSSEMLLPQSSKSTGRCRNTGEIEWPIKSSRV